MRWWLLQGKTTIGSWERLGLPNLMPCPASLQIGSCGFVMMTRKESALPGLDALLHRRTSAQTHFCTWQTYHSDSWQSLERATASSAQHRQHVSKDQRGYLLSLVVEEAGLYQAQVTLAINGAKKTCCGPRHPSRFQAVSDLQRSQAALCMIWTHIECIGSRPWHKISCEPRVISSTYRMHRA